MQTKTSLGTLTAVWKLPDLRRRILFVFGMFAVFVVGLHIPVPHIDREAMGRLVEAGGGLFALFDVFSGGAFRKFSIFAMSITPYINASIIFQLLGIAVPRIAQLAKEGETGQKKIAQWTRWLTMGLAVLQATGLCLLLRSQGILTRGGLQFVPIVLTLTAGTAFLMWMGEQITDKGIGNGVSLVIFVGIMVRLPSDVAATWQGVRAGIFGWDNVLLLLLIWLGTIAAIVYIQQGQRRIPMQYAKRVIGNRVYGGHSTFLPMRVNTAGVIPIIFAISVSLFPAQISTWLSPHLSEGIRTAMQMVVGWLTPGEHAAGSLVYFLLVILFTYFYTAIVFPVADVADNLRKTGGFIPGIRPGRPTTHYLDRVLSRITLAGALFLGVIALLSYYVPDITGVSSFTIVGGTSLLIMVGVALETMQQIEAHLVMRQYEGFIR